MTNQETTPNAADVKRAAEQAAGLRALADMIEANPNLTAYLDRMHVFYPRSAAEQAAIARAGLKHGATVEKDVWEKQHNILLKWGRVSAFALASRETVCERVVVGTETVTTTVKDPAKLAALPDVEVTEEVEIVEWQCKPLLASGSDVTALLQEA